MTLMVLNYSVNSYHEIVFKRSTSCHPPVTLVTLKKGCRRPVHRRSVTLSPFLLKNSVSLSLVASRYISLSPQSCQVKCHKVTKRTTTKSKNCLGIRLCQVADKFGRQGMKSAQILADKYIFKLTMSR